MGSDTAALFRDLLYLSALLIGAALGCILSLFRGDLTSKCRDRIVSLIFCILSGVVIVITAIILKAPGGLSRLPALILPAAVIALIFLGACRFPRAGALLFLPAGLCVVWLGYSFLRFPRIGPEGNTLGLLGSRGDGTYSLGLELQPKPDRAGSSGMVHLDFPGGTLELEGVYVFFDERFPLIGGEGRGFIRGIRRNGEPVFSGPLGESSLLGAYYALFPAPAGGERAGFFFRRFYRTLDLAPLPSGGTAEMILGPRTFSFRPSYW
jgi:multisubunit Na+/H+ antiporter MnhB subunit